MDVKLIYSESILERMHMPKHKKDLPGANRVLRGVNASCGDDIRVILQVDDGIIQDGTFEGHGCAISMASADIMLDVLIGKKVDEAKDLAQKFMEMVKGTAAPDAIAALQGAAVFRDINRTPSRIRCAALAWSTIHDLK